MDRIAPFHLRTLIAIARLGTFQAAAERLNTTQPAVSSRMRELELQLGTKLFKREGRRMSLTPRGRQLVTESELAIAELDKVLMRAADTSFTTGSVKIGTGEIASASCVLDFVREVRTDFPNVSLEIGVDLTARMLENLLAARSDMVFLAGPVAHPAIRTTSLGSLDLVWLADRTTAAAITKHQAQTIWSLPAHSPLHHVVQDLIAERKVDCIHLNTCNNVRTLIDIVVHGGGVGLLPETMVRNELLTKTLVEVYPRPSKKIEFQAAIRKRETDPLILRLFEFAVGLDIDPER